ncbi:translation elongation factor 2 (EF-2/EF-G) [Melioribacter roseus P3M-2]|uniref:Translation elongation factor 2 (EF-2/EF-G) n=1 Tax=Melioribacter roseus (strain DSM 23840 / JCM 17771 / VKM B-2668 / P3M-2) TaxID=1191523 RepID=I6ZA01_MELRP|nr:GTP-binding protein [Melioribacter roseus]AFN75960.1 translation elongation factor 2 (EF-2/EF-G) [Melioribacter roseus P3M-2]
MKEYNPDAIRNISLIGHGGSGKTSISELLLFTSGATNRIGKIEEGNTISDFNQNEIEKQISIYATPLHMEWNNKKLTCSTLLAFPTLSDR